MYMYIYSCIVVLYCDIYIYIIHVYHTCTYLNICASRIRSSGSPSCRASDCSRTGIGVGGSWAIWHHPKIHEMGIDLDTHRIHVWYIW